jgi:hypothetical protein
MPEISQAEPAAPRITVKRVALIALAIVACVALGLAIIVYIQVRQAPAWWTPMESTDASLADMGRALENRVPTVLSDLRPGTTPSERAQPWRLLLPSSQANAWLATRLAPWLENRGYAMPKGIEQTQVNFGEGSIAIGFQCARPGKEPLWLGATLKPEVRADGSLWLSARSISIGRLGLPPTMVLDERGTPTSAASVLGKLPPSLASNADVQRVVRVLMSQEPALKDASIALPDGRRVRVLSDPEKRPR